MFSIHVVAAWLMAGLTPASVVTARPPLAHLVVRTYVASRVAPSRLASARSATQAVFQDAGIEVVWRECDGAERAAACSDAPGPGEAIVRLVGAGPQAPAGLLGSSFVDAQQQSGCLATIYVDRVEALASLADFDPGTLLGRTIAHELGHLLLGTATHSGSGLMRARWSDAELRRARRSDWMLSRVDATRMRVIALARAGIAAVPAALVAAGAGR